MKKSRRNTVLLMFLLLMFFILDLSCNESHQVGDDENDTTELPDSIYPPADIIISTHGEWTRGHYPERILYFKNNPLNYGDIVMLGNSITEQGGDWAQRFNNSEIKNRGISGDTTEGVLARLGEINYFKPSIVFILIGINDLFNDSLSADYVAGNIITITQKIHKGSPETEIFVQTVFPTSTEGLVVKIQQVNDLLKASEKNENYTIIDLHPLFTDGNGLMNMEYSVDGVHLNEKAYGMWVNKISKFITEE